MNRRKARPEWRGHGSDERWHRAWSHREQLLKVARRRSLNPEDAEDAVHEAMLRAVETPGIDDERLGAWLTTVTMRLCVDRYRQVDREVRDHSRLVPPGPVPLEEAVCDRDEARWLAGRSGELPARQAEALRLKSQDLDVGQVAGRMGLSYEAVESLLARARRSLRSSLAGTLSAAALSSLWARVRDGVSAPAVAAASATFAVLGAVVVPHLPVPHRDLTPVPPAGAVLRGESAGEGGEGSRTPDVPAGSARLAAVRADAGPADLTGLVGGLPQPLPEVPDPPSAGVAPPVPLPATVLPEPGRPELPGPSAPDAGSGAAPDAAGPSLPPSSGTSGSTVPGTPEGASPDASQDAPDAAPDATDSSDAPDAPVAAPELP